MTRDRNGPDWVNERWSRWQRRFGLEGQAQRADQAISALTSELRVAFLSLVQRVTRR